MNKKLGLNLKEIRESSGFESQRALSKSSGVSNATIARIENNEQIPSPRTLKRLSSSLNVPYEELMSAVGYL